MKKIKEIAVMRKRIIFNVVGIALAVCLSLHSQKTQAQKNVTVSGKSGIQTVTFQNPNLDLSDKAYIAVDINNTSSSKLFVKLVYRGPWPMHTVEGAAIVSPDKNVQSKVIFYRSGINSSSPWYPAFGGQSGYGLPGNHSMHWRAFNYNDLKYVAVTVSWDNHEGGNETVTLSNPYATGEYTFPTINYDSLPKPLLDDMGQYIPDTWDMKLNEKSELQELAAQDIEKYDGASFDSLYSQYGGIQSGTKYNATGYFHTEKIDGKWWLIDPEGHLFWSVGVTGPGQGSSTPTNGRTSIFPTFDEEKGSALWPLLEQETQNGTINFYNMNVKRKYGTEWETKHEAVTYGRMKKWGLNTTGSWSNQPKINHPYCVQIWHPFANYFGSIKKMIDPFSETWISTVKSYIKSSAANKVNDPWLLGVFVSNELDWNEEMAVPNEVLKMTNTRPARLAMENFLKNKYTDIQSLNNAWGSNFDSFEKISGGNYNTAFTNDMLAYLDHFAETYYRMIAEEVHKSFPNHMYMGSRFKSASFVNKTVLNACARHSDVVSFNIYRYSLDNFEVTLETDRPWIIGEFHFGTGSHGVWGTGLMPAYDIENQGELFKHYIQTGLQHPNFVGAHWFQWVDQMPTGRGDGENCQIGLVNVTDQPYQPLVDAIKESSEKIYETRTGKSVSTSVNNLPDKMNIKIYPNPNEGQFFVQTNNLNDSRLSVFSITGQKVYETNFRGTKNIILPENLNGIFLIKVENSGETMTERILIR